MLDHLFAIRFGIATVVLFTVIPALHGYAGGPQEITPTTLMEQATTIPEHSIIKIITMEVPPETNVPHPGPGAVFGYVLEGELIYQLDWDTLKRLKQGQVYFVPAGSAQIVARNPSAVKSAKLLYIVICEQKHRMNK
jgi:quercetin dioxygenase-like cupin family protein